MKIRAPFLPSEIFIVLTIAVVFFTTVFLSFDRLIETQLLSKSYAFITGAMVCSLTVLLFRKSVEISFDLLAIMILLLVGYIIFRMGLVGQFNLKFLLATAFLLMYFFFKVIKKLSKIHVYIFLSIKDMNATCIIASTVSE